MDSSYAATRQLMSSVTEAVARHISEDKLSLLTKITMTTGALSLAGMLYSTIRGIYYRFKPSQIARYQHSPRNDESSNSKRAWALVTGASDGIGLAFAKSLASRGFNVVLHGRNKDKLAKVATLLETTHNMQTRLLVLDATEYPTSPEDYSAFEKTVLSTTSDINLTILVNNVGGVMMATPQYNTYPEIQAPHIDGLLNANLRFPAQITRLVIPRLRRNQPGLIINISSGTAVAGTPWQVVYAASKAFNSHFSASLKTEFLAEGVDIECMALEILFTATPGLAMEAEQGGGLMLPRPETVVESSLGLVGSGYAKVTPYIPHALQVNVLLWVATWWSGFLERQAIAIFTQARKEYEERIKTWRVDGGGKERKE